ncbi:MAG TPA: DUF3466 family protein [Thermoanaerobaculia bacterium]
MRKSLGVSFLVVLTVSGLDLVSGQSVGFSHRVPRYTITDIGALPPGGWSTGYGVNQSGTVAGSGGVGAGYHAVRFETGVLTDLGTWNGQESSIATAINNGGTIVGSSLGDSFGQQHAVRWSGGSVLNLGSLPGTTASEAEDVNDAGQIVGSSIVSYFETRAFLWQDGAMTALGTLGGTSSAAYGINASGQIVGSAYVPSDVDHAFLWQNGEMTDLGMPPGWQSSLAVAISDNGKVAGTGADATGHFQAFLLVDGTWSLIGAIGSDTTSEATDVNSAGYVVGFSTSGYLRDPGGRAAGRAALTPSRESLASRTNHAWLYVSGHQYDLQTRIPANSGWTLVRADAINENGQIVGTGWAPDGFQHGFLLTPAQ